MAKVVNHLSKSGTEIVQSFNKRIQGKARPTQTVLVGFKELKTTKSYLANKTSDAHNLLSDLSSQIKVINLDGTTENFGLLLTKGYNPKQANSTIDKQNTWIALDPARFYVKEDRNGEEIFPIIFPATSLDDPNIKVNVTLHQDGTLTWPTESTNDMAANITSSGTQEMLYVTPTPMIIQPCEEDGGPGNQFPCDDGGGGDTGGGDGGGQDDNLPVEDIQMPSFPFLAVKSIYTTHDGDPSGGWELQMYVDATDAVQSSMFERRWNYVFDRRYGQNGLLLAWGDGHWWQVFGGSLLIVTQFITGNYQGAASLEFGSIFSGWNSRTIAVDGRVYEAPDVNYKNTTYNFTNMRTWELVPNYISGPASYHYEESAHSNYFPAVLLGGDTFSIV